MQPGPVRSLRSSGTRSGHRLSDRTERTTGLTGRPGVLLSRSDPPVTIMVVAAVASDASLSSSSSSSCVLSFGIVMNTEGTVIMVRVGRHAKTPEPWNVCRMSSWKPFWLDARAPCAVPARGAAIRSGMQWDRNPGLSRVGVEGCWLWGFTDRGFKSEHGVRSILICLGPLASKLTHRVRVVEHTVHG